MTNQPKMKIIRILIFCLMVFFLFQSTANVNAFPLQQEGPIYIVQQNDTLNSIALRFGIPADELQSANNITDPNSLNIGQRLIIPGLEGIFGVLTSEILNYGISLTGITRQYKLNQNDLISLNRLTSPSETIVGIKFIIPVIEDQAPLTPVAIPTAGGTLLEAAIQTGTSPWVVIEDNQLAASWDLLSGEILYGSDDVDLKSAILPNVMGIAINQLPIIQGETLQIAISSDATVEFSGSFNNETLHFFSDDGENYFGYHGIHALADPGAFQLEITAMYDDGSVQSFEQLVLLSEGGYGNEWVTVEADYLDETLIAEEDAFLQPILEKVTPERHWEGSFQYPVDEPCVNSVFGQRRDYNNGGLFFYHTGMDFAVCAQNINIYAPAAGEVVMTEELFIKGKAILIDHGWGVFSGYWHLSEFNVNVGDFVQPGDLIGLIGDTGRSAGPHLHFEIDITGTPVNPETWLTAEFPQPVP